MNFKTTIVLLIVLAAAGAYFAVGRLSNHVSDTAAQTTPGKLIDLDSAGVKQVSITQPDGKKIVLAKTGATWNLTEPVAAPADSSTVDEFIRQITGLQSHGKLPAEQKGSVGLDHPNYVVELTANDGKVTKLSVGDKSQISDALYVIANDNSAPDVVSTGIYEQLGKSADTYRSKKLVTASTDQIQQVAITQNGQTLRLEKQGANWQITAPKSMPADSGEISSLLFTLTDLNAVDFVSGAPKPQAYGLANPAMSVWFSTAAPSTQPAASTAQPAGTTIAFGRFDSVLQKNVYASVNGGSIVTVPVTSETSLAKTPLELRDRKALDVDPAQVESFTLSANRPATTQPTTHPAQEHEYTLTRRQEKSILGPTLPEPTTAPATQSASTQPVTLPSITATQPASKWMITSGGSGDANDPQVDALLTSLHPLRADKYLDKAPAATQPVDAFTLTLHVGPANSHGPADYTLHLSPTTATGPAIGTLNDLTFETDRTLLDKLDVNFKGGK